MSMSVGRKEKKTHATSAFRFFLLHWAVSLKFTLVTGLALALTTKKKFVDAWTQYYGIRGARSMMGINS